MKQTVEQAMAALATSEAAYQSELERDSEREPGSHAQEQRREDHQKSLRDDIEKCKRDVATAKTMEAADKLAARLAKLHGALEARGDQGTDWSLAFALEDRIGGYQPVSGDVETAEQLLKKHGF